MQHKSIIDCTMQYNVAIDHAQSYHMHAGYISVLYNAATHTYNTI